METGILRDGANFRTRDRRLRRQLSAAIKSNNDKKVAEIKEKIDALRSVQNIN